MVLWAFLSFWGPLSLLGSFRLFWSWIFGIWSPKICLTFIIYFQVENNSNEMHKFINEKAKISLSKERKAARTMAIIVTTFIVCWLPFFLMYVILPFCRSCSPSPKVKILLKFVRFVLKVFHFSWLVSSLGWAMSIPLSTRLFTRFSIWTLEKLLRESSQEKHLETKILHNVR